MSDFQLKTLETIKKAELIDVFNSAFTDYFVKIELNERTLADKILAENIVLEKSVGAFLAGKLIGFILIGIEGKKSYNAGTGVLPKFRGNALTKQMYGFILPKLKLENIHSHQLEVITENLPAIKIYQKIGFEIVRTLACFKGKIAISKTNGEIELRILDDIEETVFSSFWNSEPSWQNSLSAIQRTPNLHKIIGAFYEKNLVGYLIYGKTGRIKQFAVKKDFRHRRIGQALFAQLNNQEIIITNIQKDDNKTSLFLEKLGLELFLEQFEMTMNI